MRTFQLPYATTPCKRKPGRALKPRKGGLWLDPRAPNSPFLFVQGSSEITDLYVTKFGLPPPGSRIFIWTRQVLNGRKDAPKMTCADVPPPER